MREAMNQKLKTNKPSAKTRSYHPIQTWWLRRHQRLPPLSFQLIEQMLLDETIQIGLAARRSVLQGVEFGYKANGQWQIGVMCQDEAVGAWVMRQLLTLWRIALEHITEAQTYGWTGMEVIWQRSEEYDNLWEIVAIEERHPTDIRCLINDDTGRPCGARFNRVKNAPEGFVDLHFPECFYHAFKPRPGEWYGQTVLWGSYRAWADKHLDGGAIDVRRLFMHKDAYGGADLGYPEGQTNIGTIENPVEVPNRELAREIVEQIEAGGVTTTPQVYDDAGHKMWELTRATVPSNPSHILTYPDDLDGEMLRGMGVPDGVLKADDAGSWQGRLIPMQILYATLDPWVTTILRDIREQLLEPGIINNWGKVIPFTVQHRPLAEQAMEQQRSPGQAGGGMDPSMMDPSGGGMDPSMMDPSMMDPSGGMDPSMMDPTQQGQRMGLFDSIGRGVSQATPWLRAARMAIDAKTSDDVKKKARIIAAILTDLFGEDAESHFDEIFGSAVRMGVWKSIDHPRGQDGRFIEKNSADAVHAAKATIREALKGKRTPSSLKTVTEHLSILTVKQLRSLQKEHGIRAGGRVKQALIEKIASRLHGAIVQTDEEANPLREDGTPKIVNNRDTYTVPTESLHVDPSRFQYKVKNIDASGVTEELKSVGKWNPEMAGVLLVWRDPESGKDYVVNGHHRHHLANRLGAKELNVRYIDADSPRQARAKGALANIAEGRGSSVDAAKYLRDSGHDLDHFAEAGISLKGKIAEEAGILKNLADKPFQMLTEGRLDEPRAVAVAKHLSNHETQNKLFKKLEQDDLNGKDWSNREIEQMAKKMASAGKFTDRGTDLFGDWEEERSTFDQEVELETFISRALQQTANDYRAVANQRRAERVQDAGNVLAVDENQKRADKADGLVSAFNREQHLRGAVADTIKFFAGKLAQAKYKKDKEKIKLDCAEAVRSVLEDRPAVTMSAMRAPSGYTHDHPFTVAGKSYIGGQFIPSEVIAQATPEQKKAIEAAQTDDSESPIERGKGTQHEKFKQQLITGRNIKLKNNHAIKLTYDRSTGFKIQHIGPGKIKTDFPHRFNSVHEASDFAAEQLMRRGTILPKVKGPSEPIAESKKPTEPPAPPKPKEPWEMTYAEWAGDKPDPQNTFVADTFGGDTLRKVLVSNLKNSVRNKEIPTEADLDGRIAELQNWTNQYIAEQPDWNDPQGARSMKMAMTNFLQVQKDWMTGFDAHTLATNIVGTLKNKKSWEDDSTTSLKDEHEAFVRSALLEGKNVPINVVEEYPQYRPIYDRNNAKDTGTTQDKPTESRGKNFHYPDLKFWNNGLKAKFRANVDALKTMKQVKSENREPTPEEQATIAKFVGWGQFPALLNDYNSRYGNDEIRKQSGDWTRERRELLELIGPQAFKSAQRSTTNAHYTHPEVIEANWKMAERLGFDGGRMIEPAMGNGMYVGFMPEHLAKKTKVTGVELDEGTADIAKALYPEADITQNYFQKTVTPANFYDLFATNVPFDRRIMIKDQESGIRANLHDYYFLRAARDTKPGGLAMLITSTGTLDNPNPDVMKYLDDKMEFVGAFRFPGDTHKDNAGTSVVTDMVILRKKNPSIPAITDETPSEAEPKKPGFTGTTVDSLGRLYYWKDGKRVPKPQMGETATVPDPDGGEPIEINKYFAENPASVLGTLNRSGTMWRAGMMNVERTENYQSMLDEAIQNLPQNIVRTEMQNSESTVERAAAKGSSDLNEGQLVIQDGRLWRFNAGGLTAMPHGKHYERLMSLTSLRDAALAVLDDDTTSIEDERAALNAAYDSFVAQFGPINSADNRKLLKNETDAPFLKALEKWDAKSQTASKTDIFTKDTIKRDTKATSADSVSEATGIVLHEDGRVDVQRIAKLTGKSVDEVGEELESSGLAFLPPGATDFVPASEYLSGTTREKLQHAKLAAEDDPRYLRHVRALEKAQPEDVPREQIGVRLGSPWIPPSILGQYVAEKTGASVDSVKVMFNEVLSRWDVSIPRFSGIDGIKDYAQNRANEELFSVGEWSFAEMLDRALNDRGTMYMEQEIGSDGSKRQVKNTELSDEAATKMRELQDDFRTWLWDDEARANSIEQLYNNTQNDIKPRNFDGSHLQFPGMAAFEANRLYPIQKNAVWRVVTTGRGLLAHEVGTGKTNTMVASAMELRRLNLAKKPCIACMKANVEQITKEAQQLYPNAKILSVAGKFGKADRQKTMNQISTGDWDLVILSHDNLEMMRMKSDNMLPILNDELAEIEAAIIEAESMKQDESGNRKSKFGNDITKRLNSRKEALQQRISDALAETDKDAVFFEDTGIDQLFVDEAHKFKSLPVYTSAKIKGIPTNVSNRALDMLFKTRYLLKRNNNRGVVFATGTPISNTMAELYTMQRYLQPQELERRGLHHFDNWKKQFGESTHDFETKVTGNREIEERFAKFTNLPELRHLASDFMDIQFADDVKTASGEKMIQRPKREDRPIICESRPEVDEFMREMQNRAADLKRNPNNGDNWFTILDAMRKGSIDLRLVDPDAEDHPDSKVNQAVRNILKIYNENPGKTQCVFSELGIHDDDGKFSIFDDIRKKLIAGGIPAEEIANFSDADMKGDKRDDVQAAMKAGNVRIAMGSTSTLGTGVNVQTRLLALHHIDIPYVPASLEQRIGRGYRMGNTIMKEGLALQNIPYVQRGSADDMLWGILGRKTNFINQYMKGGNIREMEDLSMDTISPEEMQAIATGDERVLEQMKLENQIRTLTGGAIRHQRDQQKAAKKIESAPERKSEIAKRIAEYREDIQALESNPEFSLSIPESIGSASTNERGRGADLLTLAFEHVKNHPQQFSSYTWHKVASVRGFDVEARRTPDSISYQIKGPSGQTATFATPSLQSVEYAIRSIPKKVDSLVSELALVDQEVAKAKSQLGKPYRYQADLEEATRKIGALKQAIQNDRIRP